VTLIAAVVIMVVGTTLVVRAASWRAALRRLAVVTADEALDRLLRLGLDEDDARTLFAHFDDAERRGKAGHGYSRVEWLESVEFDRAARPRLVVAGESYEHWDGAGCLGYLVLAAVVRRQLEAGPEQARLVVCSRTFPTGVLGFYGRALAEAGLVAALTATSPRRLPHPDGGPPLTGTNPLAIAIPSGEGEPLVADVSMGATTYGAVLAGLSAPDELVPFGGGQSHKAFALAAGLQLLVEALAGPEHGAVLLVARPDHDPVPAFRELAAGLRLPGDS
jgi:LDH2 family malate/lactate/ureidoglycolate dehydrogenase